MAISTDRSAAGFEKQFEIQAVHTAASRENQDTRGPPWQTDFSPMLKRGWPMARALGDELLRQNTLPLIQNRLNVWNKSSGSFA
jgi:hypothetical protein